MEFPDNVCGIDVMTSLFRAGTTFEPGSTRRWTAHEDDRDRQGDLEEPHQRKVLAGEKLGPDHKGVTSFREAGSFTVVETFLGLGVQLKVPNGPVQSFSAGRLVLEILATLLPESRPVVELLGFRFLAGPRAPESLQGSPEFCAVVTDALT